MGNATSTSDPVKATVWGRAADWLLSQGSAVIVAVSCLGVFFYGLSWALPYTIGEFKALQMRMEVMQKEGIVEMKAMLKQQQDYDRERDDRQRAGHENVVRMILEGRIVGHPQTNAGK